MKKMFRKTLKYKNEILIYFLLSFFSSNLLYASNYSGPVLIPIFLLYIGAVLVPFYPAIIMTIIMYKKRVKLRKSKKKNLIYVINFLLWIFAASIFFMNIETMSANPYRFF